VTCPSCGLVLPSEARFCARCGVRQPGAPAGPAVAVRAARPAAPVWLLVLLWVGAGVTLWTAAFYGALALGVISPAALGGGPDTGSLQAAAGLIAICAGSLSVAHGAAALGLMGGRSWSRTFATMVCVVWALSCVGLPLGLLGINALWRARRGAGPSGPALLR
jgi:hypothetical protein